MHFLWYRKSSENVVGAIKCLNLISILMLRVKACIDHASFIVNKPKASAQFLTGLKLLPTPFSVPWPSLSVVKGEACTEQIVTFHSAVHFSFLTLSLSLYIYIFFWTSLSRRPSETFVMHFRRFFHLSMRWGHDCFFIYVPHTEPHVFFFFFSLLNNFSWATFTESHALKIELYSSVIPFHFFYHHSDMFPPVIY